MDSRMSTSTALTLLEKMEHSIQAYFIINNLSGIYLVIKYDMNTFLKYI